MTMATAAANRFGLGAMPGELAEAADARDWLHAQLRASADSAAFRGLPSSLTILQRETAYRRQRRQNKDGREDTADAAAPQPRRRAMAETDADGKPTVSRRELARDNLADIAARYRHAATTTQPLVERLVRFWSNHFAVSADKGTARLYAAPMEREAIRPHVLGNFADLLLAVETHPAMLRYLDNVASVGDASMLVTRAQRRTARRQDDPPKRQRGINENLAREILELHTLGVGGGYTQADVTELARAITGWGTPLPREFAQAQSAFVFRPIAHEPGARRVLGKSYADAGEAQGRAILRDLALHPATAKHLSSKLATHLVSDTPPDALVQRMARAYLDSGGELRALYAALIDGDEAWSDDARKFKTPDDFVISAMRAGELPLARRPNELIGLLRDLGQPVFTPRSPAGFPDHFGDWAAGDALRKRLQVATTLAARVTGERTPLQFAHDALGTAAVAGDFATALQRAGSPQDGYALLFASPAFQWRS